MNRGKSRRVLSSDVILRFFGRGNSVRGGGRGGGGKEEEENGWQRVPGKSRYIVSKYSLRRGLCCYVLNRGVLLTFITSRWQRECPRRRAEQEKVADQKKMWKKGKTKMPPCNCNTNWQATYICRRELQPVLGGEGEQPDHGKGTCSLQPLPKGLL